MPTKHVSLSVSTEQFPANSTCRRFPRCSTTSTMCPNLSRIRTYRGEPRERSSDRNGDETPRGSEFRSRMTHSEGDRGSDGVKRPSHTYMGECVHEQLRRRVQLRTDVPEDAMCHSRRKNHRNLLRTMETNPPRWNTAADSRRPAPSAPSRPTAPFRRSEEPSSETLCRDTTRKQRNIKDTAMRSFKSSTVFALDMLNSFSFPVGSTTVTVKFFSSI